MFTGISGIIEGIPLSSGDMGPAPQQALQDFSLPVCLPAKVKAFLGKKVSMAGPGLLKPPLLPKKFREFGFFMEAVFKQIYYCSLNDSNYRSCAINTDACGL